MTKKFWNTDEFVTYDEYATYGISGEQRDRNMMKSDKLGVPESDRCPLCFKPLKDGSYKTLYYKDVNSCDTYFMHPVDGSEPIKVGNGCFKHLNEAYKEKYQR